MPLAEVLAPWLTAAAATAFFLALRLLPVVLLLPVFGGMNVPSPVRLGALAALIVASWPAELTPMPAGAAAFAVGASQLLVGLATAACVLATVEILRMLGALADVVLGRGSFGAGDPLQPDPDGPLGQMHALFFVAILTATGSHLVLVEALRRGVERFGPTAVLAVADVDVIGQNMLAVLQTALETALALAMPAMATALLVDLLLGWIQRVLPQVPASFLAMPLRQLFGWTLVAAVAAAAPAWVIPLIEPAAESSLPASSP
jgi:flagellar biosynthetic protein FliR